MSRAHRTLGPLAALSLCAGCATQGAAQLPEAQPPSSGLAPPAVARRSLGATLDPTQAARALHGYGDWVETRAYGRVWIPRAQQGFVPYRTDGRWVVSDAGWYWQSALPWGDVAFHYGRWVQLDALWAWAPGSVFAPAWVDWRSGNGWVAWAPRAPRNAAWAASFAFCPVAQALDPNVSQRVVVGAAAASLFPRTTPVPARRGPYGAVYAPGPVSTDVPAPQAVPIGSLAVPVTVRPRPMMGPVNALTLAGYEPAGAPTEIPDEPVAQGEADVAQTTAADARPAVRIRDVDLARSHGAPLSVVNLPASARAALFAQRPTRPLAPPPPEASAVREVDAPPPLPPPADVPYALRPLRGFGRVGPRVLPYEAPLPSLPPAVGAPSSPGIGVSTMTPSAAFGGGVGVTHGGGMRAAVAVPMTGGVGVAQTAAPMVANAPPVMVPMALPLVAR